MKKIMLSKIFDAHMHWRQFSTLLSLVAPYSMRQFSGGLLMPNTKPELTTYQHLIWYRNEIMQILAQHKSTFLPVFTYYLSTELTIKDLVQAWRLRLIGGVKYYPQGGTTNSTGGLAGFTAVKYLLDKMQELGIPLLIHSEVPKFNGKVVNDFKREHVFLEHEMIQLRQEFPGLRIVMEHITTGAAAQFVIDHDNTWATITPQHCLVDSRALFNEVEIINRKAEITLSKNGMRPAWWCRPALKPEEELQMLQDAIIFQAKNGLRKFGLGTDTAPHPVITKESDCCACGVYSAPIAIELYATAFEAMGILDHLQVFAGEVMPEFYGIADRLSEKTIILKPDPQLVAMDYDGIKTPFGGMSIPWKVVYE